ncbi:MAG: hypothetical protein J4415_00885 [Candidatus Diapherotrites archaeon]|uniref:tRNA(Phe) 7-((3-amino-3-carboxypropyl)-4-demethylwyosine(37)-N(4))-methyltransferase n=1 Tax=Candidatus Iainarchaeum sp. TaxID=3101447 RepID=A0A8T4KQ68_9ARCH|nr:hypothetical protein [Candidatus Diapherotrites archaeon]
MKKQMEFPENERWRMSKLHNRQIWEEAVSKGEADAKMRPICNYINSTENFFTSSGCAGRIMLLGLHGKGTKQESYFHRKWHREVKFPELWDGLEEKSRGIIWFKMEPFIIHIGTKNLEDADSLLNVMRNAGVKRGGIIVAKKGKCIAEFVGTQSISLPVKKGAKIMIDKNYMKRMLDEANSKLGKNYELLKRLEKVARAELK